MAFSQKPKTADAYYAEGLAFLEQNKLQDALSSFNKAITKNTKHYKAYTQAGLILVRLNNKEDALTCLKTAIKLKKDNAIAYNGLGVLYKNVIGKPDSSLFYFKKLVLLNADTSAEINYNIGWSFNALQLQDSAIVYLKKALAINNDYRPAYREIAYSYHKLKKYNEAIEQFNKNIAVSKIDLPYFYIGMCYLELNQKENALKTYEELKVINPKLAESLKKKIDEKK
ncbi:MAG: tetratricopeptide repeat protein [Chitinophagaceae bacterium]|nr:tetratricopeptide repeat protein [Chitinophagaceae bacterium]